MMFARVVLWLLALSVALFAQPWRTYRSTVLIDGYPIGGQVANTVAIPSPANLSVGRDGNLYFNSSTGAFVIDGSGTLQIWPPASGVQPFAVSASGTTYISSSNGIGIQPLNGTFRVVAPDIPGRPPLFTSIAVDSLGRAYVIDSGSSRIFRVDEDGNFTLIAGFGSPIALASAPFHIAVDSSDRLILTNAMGQILRMTPGASPQPLVEEKYSVGSLAIAPDNTIYFYDPFQQDVMRLRAGKVDLVLAKVGPASLAVDGRNRLVVATSNPPQILRLEADGTRSRIAGLDVNNLPPPNGAATALNNPRGLALDLQGNLLIADRDQNRILRRKASGEVEAISTGVQRLPGLLAVGGDGSVYIGTIRGLTVQKLNSMGEAELYAGSGGFGMVTDGEPAKSTTLAFTTSIAWTPKGLAIAEGYGNRIRYVDSNGRIYGLVGDGTFALGGENEPALRRGMAEPGPMAVDRQGNLIYLEQAAARFRRLSTEGTVSTVRFLPGDSASQSSCLLGNAISSVAVDSSNHIFFTLRGALCRIEPDGSVWLVRSNFGNLSSVVIDKEDRIYVADSLRNQITMLQISNVGLPYELQPKISTAIGAAGSRSPSVAQYSPGALLTVYGSGFAPAGTLRAVEAGDLVGGALPTRLAGVCVLLGGVRAPLTFVGASQINFQAPTSGTTSGEVRVVANCDGAQEFTSLAFRMESRMATPELLYWTSTGANASPVVAVEANTNDYIGATGLIPGFSFRPAKPGDVLTIYGISFGMTQPALAAGVSASGPAEVRGGVQVYINDQLVPAGNVLYVGASPGIAGLYQINLRVPDVADGNQRIRVVVDGQNSPIDGYLTIRRSN